MVNKTSKITLFSILGIFLFVGIFLFYNFVSGLEESEIEDKKITYTPSTQTICENGICTKTLYSGIRFVEEDNEWKKIEDARSLKDKGFNIIYLEKDHNPEFIRMQSGGV